MVRNVPVMTTTGSKYRNESHTCNLASFRLKVILPGLMITMKPPTVIYSFIFYCTAFDSRPKFHTLILCTGRVIIRKIPYANIIMRYLSYHHHGLSFALLIYIFAFTGHTYVHVHRFFRVYM